MDATGSTSDEVTLSLNGSEALVLADALGQLELEAVAAVGSAEWRVLTEVVAVLEPLVDVAFSGDYAEHLERARADVLRSSRPLGSA